MSDNAHPFTDDQIALASSNYEAQAWLISRLQEMFVMCETTIDQLALDLDLSVEDAQAWIDGEVDLTLSELRHLANALDAKVSYRVSGMQTRYISKFAAMQRSSHPVGEDVWVESDWKESYAAV